MSFRIAGLLAVLLLAGCAKTKLVDTWQNESAEGEEPQRVAVLAAWPDELQRLVIERDMAEIMRESGAAAIASSNVHGMRGNLTRESVERALRNDNVDAVVIVFVMGGGRGDALERSDYWALNVGGGVGGWYSPYFYDVYAVREGPGYAEYQDYLKLETSYIDLRELERMWSMVTVSEDIQYQDVASKLAAKIVKQMKKAGQL